MQEFDLNYAGVILGPPLVYDETMRHMVIDTEKVTHRGIYKKSPHLITEQEIANMQQSVMYHAASILLTRGINGLYLTVADENLRAVLVALQED